MALTGCSTFIYIGEESRATLSDLMIYIGSVPTEHLSTFDVKLHESFRRIVREGIHMDRMLMVIDREERQVPSPPPLMPFAIFSHRSQVPQQTGIRRRRCVLDNHDW
jgi:hypothetical protein